MLQFVSVQNVSTLSHIDTSLQKHTNWFTHYSYIFHIWYVFICVCLCIHVCMWSLMCAESRRALLVWLTWLEAAVDHTVELQGKLQNIMQNEQKLWTMVHQSQYNGQSAVVRYMFFSNQLIFWQLLSLNCLLFVLTSQKIHQNNANNLIRQIINIFIVIIHNRVSNGYNWRLFS